MTQVDSQQQEAISHGRRQINFVLPAAALFFAFCCGLVLYVHATARILPYDDSYITYRYVSNFFEGKGLVYNQGERVFGSSTPLYMAWLILLKALLPWEIPTLAVRGNALFFLAAGFGFLFVFRHLLKSTAVALVAAGLFFLQFHMLIVSLGGIEAYLFCALALWCFYFLMKGRYIPSGALAGLSVVARPEGMICLFLVGLSWLLYERKKAAAFIASMIAPGLIWTVFSLIYYGTPVYHSLLAKSRPLYPFPPGFAFGYLVHYLASWSATPFRTTYHLCIIAAIALAGFMIRRRELGRIWFIFPGYVALILAFYGVGNPFVFAWYLPNVFLGWYPFLTVGVAYCLAEAVERIDARCRRRGRENRRVMIQALAALVPLLLFADSSRSFWQKRNPDIPPGYYANHHGEFRTQSYRQAAEFINRASTSPTTIAAPEVGALGYYSKHHLYDSCGLVTPEALPFLPVPYGKRVGPNIGSMSAAFAREVNADWIVAMEVFTVEDLIDNPWFKENYVLVKVIPLQFETFGSRNVMIFLHKEKTESGLDN